MKLLLLKLLLILAITSLDTYACSCENSLNVSQAAKSSEVIYTGQVISIKPLYGQVSRMPVEFIVEFAVDKIFKGKHTNYVKLRNASPGACGFPFQVKKRYLVYSSKYKGELSTNKCSRTKDISKSLTDIQELKKVMKI